MTQPLTNSAPNVIAPAREYVQLMCSVIDYKYCFPGTTRHPQRDSPHDPQAAPSAPIRRQPERTRRAAVHAQRRPCDPGRRRRVTGAVRPFASGRPPLPAGGATDELPVRLHAPSRTPAGNDALPLPQGSPAAVAPRADDLPGARSHADGRPCRDPGVVAPRASTRTIATSPTRNRNRIGVMPTR